MAKRKVDKKSDELLMAVVEGLLEKKGQSIKVMNFTDFPQAICNHFVVCHGTNKIQVQALAESVEEVVKKNTGARVSRREGVQNAEWILLDYFDVVVHIFEEEKRYHYKLEQLWADAPIQEIEGITEETKEKENVRRRKKPTTSK